MQADRSFTFAVLADAHIRPPDEGGSQGDYPSNRLFNDRNRYVVRLLNQIGPDFVIHLGDMPHPIPALPAHETAVQAAHDLYGQLNAPLRVLPGNHDIGDKPDAWTPAPAVTAESHGVFEKYWGPTFRSFDHGGCHFILLNSPVLNSGLRLEQEQRAWLERDLESARRVFLFMHYPLYLHDPSEGEHYDNVGQAARAWLLSLLARHEVEAVFAGHVHHFFYNRYHNTDLYVLPSVAFVRPEFSEMFHVGPAAEYGRDDAEKLGFFLVTVNAEGHRVEFVRTGGLVPEPPASLAAPWGRAAGRRVAPLGVSLRHAWAAAVEMPCDSLDEFVRKRARNDYPLLALWELGIARLRIPLADLAHEETRARVRALRAKGHTFTVFSAGPPGSRARETLARYHDLVESWEVIAPWDRLPEVVRGVREAKRAAGLQVVLSKLDTLEDQRREGELEFSHFPAHGFRLAELDRLAAWLAEHAASKVIGGCAFRLDASARPWEGIRSAAQFAAEHDLIALVHLRLPRMTEGVAHEDDRRISNQVAEAYVAALGVENVRVFLDTFVDHDRGYYPRHGLLDRRYNPRPVARVLQHLNRLLGDDHDRVEVSRIGAPARVRAFAFGTRRRRGLLVLQGGELSQGEIELPWAGGPSGERGSVQWVDLCTGQAQPVHWRRSPAASEVVSLRIPPTHLCPGVVMLE